MISGEIVSGQLLLEHVQNEKLKAYPEQQRKSLAIQLTKIIQNLFPCGEKITVQTDERGTRRDVKSKVKQHIDDLNNPKPDPKRIISPDEYKFVTDANGKKIHDRDTVSRILTM